MAMIPTTSNTRTTVTTVSVTVAGSLLLIIFAVLCKKRRCPPPPVEPDPVAPMNRRQNIPEQFDEGSLSQSDSVISSNSLLSTGSSLGSDFDNELDDTHILDDEFDKYKNENLEKVRADIVGSVSNSKDMMSQALTKALMDDIQDDDTIESAWFGSIDSTEMEASVYCEVHNWLKSKDGAGLDERRDYMQQKLNKMVATVRQGAIEPQDASRTIHGSAAMLGLELAEVFPEKALLVTGMRKKVSKKDVSEAFKVFGEIESVAVTPNERGFGLVRYRTPESAQRALVCFRRNEIIVQDVAVMIKLLKSDNTKSDNTSSRGSEL